LCGGGREEVKGVGLREVHPPFLIHHLVLFYYGDECILLVTGGNLNLMWVVVMLQTGVAARALLLDFIFL
jgi:hypothetical protein